jgi:histidinol-phosphate aminotransferase
MSLTESPQVPVLPHILKIKPYLPGRPIEEVKRQLGLKKVIKLASNENPLGPSPEAIKAIRKHALRVNLYPDGGGYYLKRALAEKLGVKEENIIIGNGSDEIVSLITRITLQKGEQAITGAPSFLMYKIDIQLNQGKVVSVPLKNFRLDLEKMEKAINSKTRLVFIGNPNNPAGTIVNTKEVERFLSNVPPQILVIFDEAYYEYVEDADYPQTVNFVKQGKNIIVLRTFSKAYGLAGLRIGYGVAKKEIIDILNRARPPFNVNSLAQTAALASLKDENQVERSRKLIKEEKKFFYSHLKKLGLCFVPTQANFILIKVGERAKDIEEDLLHRGIIVRGMQGYNLPWYIRVSIGTREQNEEFIKNFRAILSSS